jgi:enoyl-CoA hydratase/carnithine racemase
MADETDAGTPPLLTINGARATIRLNRPRALNRIEPGDIVAMMAALDSIDASPAVRVLVLTGTGRAFSAGFDLRAIEAHSKPDESTGADVSFETLANRLENLSVPTICRLNGGVYGGSTDLALACDFRIGLDTTEMFMPAARLGLHYYRSGMMRYVSRLGLNAAKMLFLTAQKRSAAELLAIGYLDEAVPADQLDARVDLLADAIAANAPRAVAAMKRSLNEIARGSADAAAINARHQASLRGDELKEGTAAVAEKRKPNFA